MLQQAAGEGGPHPAVRGRSLQAFDTPFSQTLTPKTAITIQPAPQAGQSANSPGGLAG